MRLLALRLLAFGHFEDRTLDLCPPGGGLPGFTVVYGRNEAGKSTSLRALESLLFGFEHHTSDAHRFPSKKLRVGGTLVTDRGEQLRFVRRTGHKETLRDDADRPISEAPLRAVLRGVDRELYRTLYGLDHRRLREGAKTLLSEKSSFAESLFEAGVTGAGVAKLVVSLRDEAELLFSARAREKPLNKSLRAYLEAKNNGRSYATPHEVYQKQLDGIQAEGERRAEAELDLRRIEKERRRVERGRRVAPLLLRRRGLLAQEKQLGPAPTLPETATLERERALADLTEAARSAELCDELIAELSMALAEQRALTLDPTDALATLSQLIGAVRDGIRRRATRLREREELTWLLSGQEGDRARARIDDGAIAAARRALDAQRVARERAAEETRAVAELAGLIRLDRERLVDAPLEESLAPLTRALKFAELALLRASELSTLRVELADASAVADAKRQALGTRLGLGELAALEAPTEEEVDELARRVEAWSERREQLAKEQGALRRDRQARQEEQSALLARGEVVSEEELADARAARNLAIDEGSARSEILRRVEHADTIADRLRLDADRLARLRELAAALSALEQDEVALREEAAQLFTRRSGEEENLALRMRAAGGPAVGVASARSWLARRREALAAWAHVVALTNKAALIEGEVERAERELALLLPDAAEDAALGELVDLAALRLARLGAAGDERRTTLARLREREEEAVAREARRAEAEHLRVRAEAAAAASLASLGLSSDADLEEVLRTAADARRFSEARAKLDAIADELERVAADEAKLTSYAATLAAELGAVHVGADPLAAGELLLEELRQAQIARDRRRELERRMVETQARREEARERRRGAEATLDALVMRAGAHDVSELSAIEARSAATRDLARELAQVDAQILAASDGAPLEELEQELGGFDWDAADAELERLEAEQEDADRRREAAGHARAGLEQAIRKMETEDSRASQYLEQANQELARARSIAQRYVRLRLASTLLERQIEAYRAAHQAPLLLRTEALFHELTGGSFSGLRVVLDAKDRPELVCLREGAEVGLDGLSDGAKDQLFLALRLATIERHNSAEVERLPLVLDDVLVNFDEGRAELAIRLLSTLSGSMQVLMFTHQERLAEIARALGEGRAHVVEL